jgi:hypothetical protein
MSEILPYVGVHVQCRYCQICVTLEFPRQIFEKYLNNKFYENPSSNNSTAQLFHADGQTDMAQLTATL